MLHTSYWTVLWVCHQNRNLFNNEKHQSFRLTGCSSWADSKGVEESGQSILSSASHHGGHLRYASWYLCGSLKRKSFKGFRVKNFSADRPLSCYHQPLQRLSWEARTSLLRTRCRTPKSNHGATLSMKNVDFWIVWC